MNVFHYRLSELCPSESDSLLRFDILSIIIVIIDAVVFFSFIVFLSANLVYIASTRQLKN